MKFPPFYLNVLWCFEKAFWDSAYSEILDHHVWIHRHIWPLQTCRVSAECSAGRLIWSFTVSTWKGTFPLGTVQNESVHDKTHTKACAQICMLLNNEGQFSSLWLAFSPGLKNLHSSSIWPWSDCTIVQIRAFLLRICT